MDHQIQEPESAHEPHSECGERVQYPQRVDLRALVDDALESVRPRAAARSVVLEAKHDSRQRLVQVDQERLRRAIMHLLLNALKYAEPSRPQRVWTYFNPEFVEIGIRNAGGAVRPERVRRTSGVASPANHREAVESLGLDMALAKHFVELQGGRLEIRAAARHGAAASMVIRLPGDIAAPLTATPTRRTSAGRIDVQARLEGTHVLLVEDDPDALEFLTLVLQAAGARVSAYAYTAPAYSFFVNALPQDRPDIIVSDIAMPIEDGYSFLRRMRSWEARHSVLPVPAIAVTAFSRDEDCRQAISSGFDRHVCKPLDASRLVETIAQWS